MGARRGNREWGDGRRRAFPVLHPFSTVPPLRDPRFTSSITDSVFASSPLLHPLITHADTDLRAGNWRCRCHSSFLSPLPSLLSPSPSFLFIWSALLSGRHGAISPSLTERSQPLSIINLPTIYVSCPVCVCAGGGAASGRFPVNTDLCDGSVNDFITCDKTRVEQEVSEGVWGLGEEVTLGARVPETSRLYNPKTGSSSPIM